MDNQIVVSIGIMATMMWGIVMMRSQAKTSAAKRYLLWLGVSFIVAGLAFIFGTLSEDPGIFGVIGLVAFSVSIVFFIMANKSDHKAEQDPDS